MHAAKIKFDVEDHYVTATYSGDSTFASSPSDPYDQGIDPASTTTAVSIADNTNPQDGSNPGYGDQITFAATVARRPPAARSRR